MEDYYEILGVKPSATTEEIQERFRFLAQAFHPDKYSTVRQKQLAEEEFKKINIAYQILSNSRKRSDYDLRRPRNSSYSASQTTSVNRKEEETRQRAWKEQKRKEEEARQRAWQEQKRKAEEAAQQRARDEQKRKDQEFAKRRAEEERKRREAENQRGNEKGEEEQKRTGYQQNRTTYGKIVSVYTPSNSENIHIVAANIAAQAALAGKRVGILDANLLSPRVHYLFGITESKLGKTINDFLLGKAKIQEIGHLIEGNTSAEQVCLREKNLFLFPSSYKGKDISQIAKEGVDFNRLNECMQSLLSEFNLDHLFVLANSGFNEETLLTIATSDSLVVAIKPGNPDMQQASIIIDIARALDIPNLYMIIDNTHPEYDHQSIKEHYESQLQVPVIGILPLSLDVVDRRHEDIFSINFPDHEWSRSIRNISSIVIRFR